MYFELKLTRMTSNNNLGSNEEILLQERMEETPILSPSCLSECDSDLEGLEEIEGPEIILWVPYLLKHILFLTIGCILTIVPIICIVQLGPLSYSEAFYFKEKQSNSFKYASVIRNLTWLAASLIMIVLISLIVGTLPRIVLKITKCVALQKSELVKHYLEVYNALKTTIKVSLSIVAMFILWIITFPGLDLKEAFDPQKKEEQNGEVIFLKVMLSILTFTLIITAEKLILQIIAVRFHRTAYRSRLDESNYATSVLDKLNKARKRQEPKRNKNDPSVTRPIPPYMSSEKQIQAFGSSSEVSTFNSKKKHSEKYDYIYKNINKATFEGRYEDDYDPHSLAEARKLARKLFSSLQGNRKFLLVEDFYPLFPTKEDAKKAFDYFDKDGNGDISRREMRDQICLVYKERKDLTEALRDTSQVVGKLDTILMTIFSLISVLVIFVIFGSNLYNSLLPFGTFFLGLSFIFADSAKELFQSIIFLFAMHPYDAGDRVYIDKENLLVINVGLLGTKFNHVNGQVVYIPHRILLTKLIFNIRRSTSQAEAIYFQLDFDTPKEKIIALKERVNRYVEQEESREFKPDIALTLTEIVDSNKLVFYFWLEHKGNWQDGGRRWARKTRFMIALREITMDLGLRYTLLPQKIEHVNPPPYLSSSSSQ